MTSIEIKLKEIISSWFYEEPLLFSAVCTHRLVENPGLSVPFRSGNFHIEFNPELLAGLDPKVLEEYFKIEVYRILLLHPYARQPYNAKKLILLLASDLTIAAMYKLLDGVVLPGVEYMKSRDPAYARAFESPGKVFMYENLSFEEWYKKLYDLISASQNGQNAGGADEHSENLLAMADESAALWEENEEAQNKIKDEIQKAEVDEGWGGIGGELERSLKEETDFSFDYRRALSKFRANIVSSSRNLTRMKPSRRFGFQAMGSRYERKANILIAVDVSGSITDESFNHFYKAIKNIFFLGIIEKIDVIFFDTSLKNLKPVTFKKKIDLGEIKGRGGTNFQPAIDFYFENKTLYNGLIIFTDGQGQIPVIKAGSANILWILTGRQDYEKCRQWISNLPGNKSTYLPF
ncbi:MAG: VWA-like domain-containing protein [Treponema sp.]|nr:VWA-like domain-containing protein [Treponema sp.]